MEYQTEFTITKSGDIQVPVKLKERHFPAGYEPERSVVQAIGRDFLISIWSPRDFIEIRLPLNEWYSSRPYGRSLSSGRINIKRWQGLLDTVDGENTIIGDVSVQETDWVPKHPENL